MNLLFRPLCSVAAVLSIFLLFPLCVQLAGLVGEGSFSVKALEIIGEKSYLRSFANTIVIGFCTASIAGFLGTLQAVLLQRTKVAGRMFFLLFFFVPFLIPTYIHTIAWSYLFSAKGAESTLYHLFYSSAGVIFILSIYYLPLTTALVMIGLKSLNRGREDAALLICSPLQVLFRITIPQLLPHIIGSSLLVMMLAMANFDVPDILRVRVVSVEIFIQLSAMYDEAGALLLALPYMILPFLVLLFIGIFQRQGNSVSINSQHGIAPIADRCICFCSSVTLFLSLTISLLMPLGLLFYSSSLMRIWPILIDSLDEITYSLLLALCTACITVCCSFPFSYLLARRHPFKNCIMAVVLLPFVLPGVFFGLSTIKVGNIALFYPLTSSSFFCLFALVSHFLFLSVKIIQSGIEQIPMEVENAASVLQGAKRKIVYCILFPQLQGVLLCSFFVVFVCAFGELSTTLLLVPPGRETIAAKIYNVMHYGADDILATLCIITVLILFTMGGLVLLCQRTVINHFSKPVI